MFFELRQYRIKNGKRDKWVKFMEETLIPYQVSKGVAVMGSFVAQEEEDLYVWIRRWESKEALKQLQKENAENEYWQNEIVPKIDEMIDKQRMQITFLEPTPKSVMR